MTIKNTGLNTSSIKNKVLKYGLNKLPEHKKEPIYLRILKQFDDMMVYILIIAALIAIYHNEYIDGVIIIFVVILNAIIGFIQEYKADKALNALKSMLTSYTTVVRDSKQVSIKSENIVPGDILYLEPGSKVPADALIIKSNSLKIQESILTGESVGVLKKPLSKESKELLIKQIQSENIRIYGDIDNKSHAFMGTEISYGTGYAIVYATGKNTKFGNIASETTKTNKALSPLEKELKHIGIFVGKLALMISLVLLVVEIFVYNKTFSESLMFAVSVAVAAVPEGLLATMTIALAISVKKLAKQNAIIKKLSSVETLGGVTVICSDKTGTLTQNKMTITKAYFNNKYINITGTGYSLEGKLELANTSKKHKDNINLNTLYKNILISSLCINASISKNKVVGDPTEGAFIPFVNKAILYLKSKKFEILKDLKEYNINKIQEKFKRVKELPFDDKRKMMSVIVRTDLNLELLSKGAPESILSRCKYFLDKDNNIKELDNNNLKKIRLAVNKMSSEALRVLALAYKKVKDKDLINYDIENDLIFTGLVGEIDPPRKNLDKVIKQTKLAGIKTIIITGDSPTTALAIANKVGIINNKETTKVLIGDEIESLSDNELKELLAFNKNKDAEILFARVAPVHKKRIVTALQSNGEIVAVTGDGVNDAPALKKGDIGIAMGITGTDVSRESADMVLADDSFKTIITAIIEGRIIYNNFKKFIFYLFSSNIAELTLIFVAMIVGTPLPLTAVMILIINLGTDVIPALALGIDSPEKDLLNSPPRNTKEKIMNSRFIKAFSIWGVIMGLFVFGLYYYFLNTSGELIAQTVAFVSIVLIQVLNSFMFRSFNTSIFKRNLFSNKLLIVGAVFGVLMLVLFTNIQTFSNILKMSSITINMWLTIIIYLSSLVLIADYIKTKIKI